MFKRKVKNNISHRFYFCGFRFKERVYSEKCNLDQKVLSSLVNVHFMIVRFIDIF